MVVLPVRITAPCALALTCGPVSPLPTPAPAPVRSFGCVVPVVAEIAAGATDAAGDADIAAAAAPCAELSKDASDSILAEAAAKAAMLSSPKPCDISRTSVLSSRGKARGLCAFNTATGVLSAITGALVGSCGATCC